MAGHRPVGGFGGRFGDVEDSRPATATIRQPGSCRASDHPPGPQISGQLLVSSEWSQRTAMTTFTLEPHRMRIVSAKLWAGVSLTAFLVMFALLIGLVCNLLFATIQGSYRAGRSDGSASPTS